AMPVSATTGAAAMTQSALPAMTGTSDLPRATTAASSAATPPTTASAIVMLSGSGPAAASRRRSSTTAPQGMAPVVAQAAVGTRLPRIGTNAGERSFTTPAAAQGPEIVAPNAPAGITAKSVVPATLRSCTAVTTRP